MDDAAANEGTEAPSGPADVDTQAPLVRQRPPAEGRVVGAVRTRRGPKPAVLPPAPGPGPGWQRFVLRSRHGVDHECSVLGGDHEQLFFITSDFFLRIRAVVRSGDRDGDRVYSLRGRVADLPRQLAIRDPDGVVVGRVRARRRSPLTAPVTVRLTGGAEWRTSGSLAKRQYAFEESGTAVIRVDQKQVQIRDSCKIDVADGLDPALAVAVVWAVDELLEDWD